MRFDDFNQFCAYMESFTNLERRNNNYTVRLYRLDRMRKLLDHIGHPERDFLSVHIAGSKGKGSTACFIAHGIQAAGYKTGLYLSPHLSDYRERFTLCGEFFPEQALVEAANELVSRLEGFHFQDEWGTTEPTAFELYTAYAFLLFSLNRCQWAVIETGLGGRLDATNTISPQASVITPIELEHTAILGNTISLIAAEKSKIIKPGIPAFISRQVDDAREVFRNEAAHCVSRLHELEIEVESIATHTTTEGEMSSITWRSGEETQLRLAMRGEVQAENAALALLVLRTLGLYRTGLTEPALQKATLPGRMQQICNQPVIILDGAHTVQSLRHLLNSFQQLYRGLSNTVIYGALEDKDHLHMSNLLLPLFDRIIISKPGTFKKSDPDGLFLLFKDQIGDQDKPQLYLEKDSLKALRLALRTTPAGSAILCTGSFYLAGEIDQAYRLLQEEENKREVAGCP
jgi:dihydrofolate synthase/folylpolyglutamate synthase